MCFSGQKSPGSTPRLPPRERALRQSAPTDPPETCTLTGEPTYAFFCPPVWAGFCGTCPPHPMADCFQLLTGLTGLCVVYTGGKVPTLHCVYFTARVCTRPIEWHRSRGVNRDFCDRSFGATGVRLPCIVHDLARKQIGSNLGDFLRPHAHSSAEAQAQHVHASIPCPPQARTVTGGTRWISRNPMKSPSETESHRSGSARAQSRRAA